MALTSGLGSDLGLHGEDIDAIDKFVSETPIRTPAAQKVHDDWVVWITGIRDAWNSIYLLNSDQDTFDEARNRRNAFERANATSQAELDIINNGLKTGVTAEMLKGEADRRNAEGDYTVPKPPLVSTTVKTGLIIGAVVVVVGGVLAFFNALPKAILSRKGE